MTSLVPIPTVLVFTLVEWLLRKHNLVVELVVNLRHRLHLSDRGDCWATSRR